MKRSIHAYMYSACIHVQYMHACMYSACMHACDLQFEEFRYPCKNVYMTCACTHVVPCMDISSRYISIEKHACMCVINVQYRRMGFNGVTQQLHLGECTLDCVFNNCVSYNRTTYRPGYSWF